MSSGLQQQQLFLKMHVLGTMQTKYTARAPDMGRSQWDHFAETVSKQPEVLRVVSHAPMAETPNKTNRVAAFSNEFWKHRPSANGLPDVPIK